MRISIITWDANFRERLYTIDSFATQDFPQNDFELIWVDFFGSNKLVADKIRSYRNTRLLTLGHLPSAQWHLAKCINAGFEVSKGEVIIVPDGDVIVGRNFIEQVWSEHENQEQLALYFRRYDQPRQESTILPYDIARLEKVCELKNPSNYAGCLTLKRNTFRLVKGYESHPVFGGPGMSAMELYIRIKNAGACVKWARDLKVYHPFHAGSGPTRNLDAKALRIARGFHHWISPYSGIEQSWVTRCRDLHLDIQADEDQCSSYLSQMPAIPMDYYRELAAVTNRQIKTRHELPL